jgi:hypothetical protein
VNRDVLVTALRGWCATPIIALVLIAMSSALLGFEGSVGGMAKSAQGARFIRVLLSFLIDRLFS